MYIYKLHNDLTIFAKDDEDFMKRLFWRSIFRPEKNFGDWLEGFSARIYKSYGVEVRNDNAVNFVSDLKSYKLLTITTVH